jgi:hypothetical protein
MGARIEKPLRQAGRRSAIPRGDDLHAEPVKVLEVARRPITARRLRPLSHHRSNGWAARRAGVKPRLVPRAAPPRVVAARQLTLQATL